ncbi:tRNA 4-thiouridine(8) synthase ThiI [Candidatus Bathyarchaeota archaeon]|nr:tRNA 4-thiouridine(8) synthase ThiI [Candidatus Bathyarchaeota archaeon]
MKLDSVIVRFGGEIGIKGEWTRRSYERLLSKNIEKFLTHHNTNFEQIVRQRGRIYIKTNKAREAASRVTRVFGVSSASPATVTISDINSMTEQAVGFADAALKDKDSFAIRCRRVGKHPYSSMDVCRKVGKQILAQLKDRNIKVDLNDPEFLLGIEIRGDQAYIFVETYRGMDGLPLGSQAKVVCLLSEGMDSPVACWLAMKRGCPIVPLHFDNTPFSDEAATKKAFEIAEKLFEWSIGFPRRICVVPHGKNLETLVRESPRRLTCILCKRIMYRISKRIAETERAEGIMTGEAIGEQASQTLHNLRILNEAVNGYPVHRPILTFNKRETERLARKISTFEISARRSSGCSAASKRPTTKAKFKDVKRAEQELDIEAMIDESVEQTKAFSI